MMCLLSSIGKTQLDASYGQMSEPRSVVRFIDLCGEFDHRALQHSVVHTWPNKLGPANYSSRRQLLSGVSQETRRPLLTSDVKRIRPFVSDNLFQSMLYWIELCKQQRCRNVAENTRMLRRDLANIIGKL
jgi:hypothetical protein